MLLYLSILIALGAASVVQAATAKQLVADLNGFSEKALKVIKEQDDVHYYSTSPEYSGDVRYFVNEFTAEFSELTADIGNKYDKLGEQTTLTSAEQTEVCDALQTFEVEVREYLENILRDFNSYQNYGNNPSPGNLDDKLREQKFYIDEYVPAAMKYIPDCLVDAAASYQETDALFAFIDEAFETGTY